MTPDEIYEAAKEFFDKVIDEDNPSSDPLIVIANICMHMYIATKAKTTNIGAQAFRNESD